MPLTNANDFLDIVASRMVSKYLLYAVCRVEKPK